MSCQNTKLKCGNNMRIRIYLEGEGEIEKSVPRITVCFFLFDLIISLSADFFSYIGMGLPGLNQY